MEKLKSTKLKIKNLIKANYKLLITICLFISLLCVGIFSFNKKEAPFPVTEEEIKENTIIENYETISIKDLKLKYEEAFSENIAPLLNVSKNQKFKFIFNALPTSISNYSSVVSVHTSPICNDNSEIDINIEVSENEDGSKELIISPKESVLNYKNENNIWGNYSKYYIKINYSMDSLSPVKLANPTIIPFSIKSPISIPFLKYNINKNGEFYLSWDKIEKAESYNVYQITSPINMEKNIKVNGINEAFKDNTFTLISNTSSTIFKDFAMVEQLTEETLTDENLIKNQEVENVIKNTQNLNISGGYFVTAVDKDGKESLLSNCVEIGSIASAIVSSYQPIEETNYLKLEELPTTVKVTMLDGSELEKQIIYNYSLLSKNIEEIILEKEFEWTKTNETKNLELNISNNIEETQNKNNIINSEENTNIQLPVIIKEKFERPTELQNLEISYVVDGTSFSSSFNIETINVKFVKDFIATQNKSIITGDLVIEDNANPNPPQKTSENVLEHPETIIIGKYKEKTQGELEEAEKQLIRKYDNSRYIINADSAVEEYLAIKLISGETEISLKAFPEIQDVAFLSDYLMKVIHQNPLIFHIKKYEYNYDTKSLSIVYEIDDVEDYHKKQEDIINKAKIIVEKIITEGMTDAEKRLAIYKYLEENALYDYEALENAKKLNYKNVQDIYANSFNAYGVLINKMGVCSGYSSTYKLLCDMAKVKCIVVSGIANGVNHTWNKVYINGEWYNIDVTNNFTNTNVPYTVYETSDESIKAYYIQDNQFEIDSKVSGYGNTTDKYNYYTSNKLNFETPEQCVEIIKRELESGKTTVYARKIAEIDEQKILQTIARVFKDDKNYDLSKCFVGRWNNFIIFVLQ